MVKNWENLHKIGLIRTENFMGFKVRLYRDRIAVTGKEDVNVSWMELQAIKNHYWGVEGIAVEWYPPQADVVNLRNTRHLWRIKCPVSTHPEFEKDLKLGEV